MKGSTNVHLHLSRIGVATYMNIVHEHKDDFDKQIARKIQDISIYRNARDLPCQTTLPNSYNKTHYWKYNAMS